MLTFDKFKLLIREKERDRDREKLQYLIAAKRASSGLLYMMIVYAATASKKFRTMDITYNMFKHYL